MDDDSTNRVDPADPGLGDAAGRPGVGVWSVGVLAAGAENTVAIEGGVESTVAAAWATATAALVRAVERWVGRSTGSRSAGHRRWSPRA